MSDLARCVPFPLELPRLSRGFVALGGRAVDCGVPLATAVAEALTATLGVTVAVQATAIPTPPERVAGAARVAVPLGSLGCSAVLEVEARLLGSLLEHLRGRGAEPPHRLAATRPEQSLLVFCALVAVDAARAAGLDRWSPLVALDGPPADVASGDLAILITIQLGPIRGWGRLLLPPAAVATLPPAAGHSTAVSTLALHGSLRTGRVTLTPDELAATAPGDVLLLDPPTPSADVVLAGGLTFRGRLAHPVLHLEEIRMTEAQASYPIVLSVEIARVRLTLGDLSRLAPGVAIPLDVRKDGAVVLRAGEDVIARGTLVDVEGALGIRVAQVGALP